ncbi:MAG: hypothetical protein BWY28_02522 [bacterium ADurb.Bin236]|nr:MAG: hypothetical protein BWY28_02522 [bacterium ADurb.Bin236]
MIFAIRVCRARATCSGTESAEPLTSESMEARDSTKAARADAEASAGATPDLMSAARRDSAELTKALTKSGRRVAISAGSSPFGAMSAASSAGIFVVVAVSVGRAPEARRAASPTDFISAGMESSWEAREGRS